ncbi:MAG: hypothetical protein JXA49_08580 [Actinobacteria bacterium]|nr:hypothetical protein [Actinomycetota bacterium]
MRIFRPGVCKSCGVANMWAKWFKVDSDNISIDPDSNFTGAFYESGEIENLFGGIEEKVGVPIKDICLEAHKAGTRQFFESALTGGSGKFAQKHLTRQVVDHMARVAPLYGVAAIKVLEFNPGGPYIIKSLNNFSDDYTRVEIAGAVEAAVQQDLEQEQARFGNMYITILRERTGDPSKFEGRFPPVKGESVGSMDVPCCNSCGAPSALTVYNWDRKAGIITERDTGLRVVYNTFAMVDTFIVELEKELGSEIWEPAIRIQAEFVKDRIITGSYDSLVEQGDSDRERIVKYADLLKRRCFGKPTVVEFDGKTLHATIRNPGSDVIIMGRILGTFEAVTGARGRISGKHGKEEISVSVEIEKQKAEVA